MIFWFSDAVTSVQERVSEGFRGQQMAVPPGPAVKALASQFPVALILAAAGIFATMHHSVGQRTQEIGIRMAMGAPQAAVARMILREGFALAGGG